MDRTRLIPPDPLEAAQIPDDQQAYAENEGLTDASEGDAPSDVERPTTDTRDEMAKAAQRGRTA